MSTELARSPSEHTPFSGAPRFGSSSGEGHSPVKQLFALVASHRRIFIALPLITAAATGVIGLSLPKQYTTVVSFTPVAAAVGNLAGLAGQFGLTLPGSDPATTPDFYAALLQTREILQPIAQHRYRVAQGRDTVGKSFIELYDVRDGDSARTLSEAIRVLQRKILTIQFDRQTGIVLLQIRSKWPELSFQMGQYTVDLLNGFNLQSRQTQASAERTFLGQRLDTARMELRGAENRLQDFLVRNRSYQNDPILLFDHDRLQRDLLLRQDVYNTLTQSFEQARLMSVRNTPSISIVESPKLALRFDRRYLLVKALAAAAVGVFLAFAWVLAGVAIDQPVLTFKSALRRVWSR